MSSDLLIREAHEEDASSIAVLLTQLGYPQDNTIVLKKLREFSDLDSANIFVAERNENVLGFLSFNSEPAFHREGRIGTITAMCVLESERGHGIGRMMVEAVEQFAVHSGCVRIAVASGVQRTETHMFYRALGYEEKTKRFVKDF